MKSWLVIFIFLLCFPPTALAAIILEATFEDQLWRPPMSTAQTDGGPGSPSLCCWTASGDAYNSGAIVGSPTRMGNYALRLEARSAEPVSSYNSSYPNRAQVHKFDVHPKINSENWYGFSVYVDPTYSDTTTDPNGTVVFQVHGPYNCGTGASPPFVLELKPSPTLHWTVGNLVNTTCQGGPTKTTWTLENVTKGIWYDFVIHAKWAVDSTGLLEVWMRPAGGSYTKVINKTGPNNVNDPDPVTLAWDIYKSWWSLERPANDILTVYFDEIRVGDAAATFEDVSPGELTPAPIDPGLLSYWTGDDGSGSTLTESAAHSTGPFPGVLCQGATCPHTSPAGMWTTGQVNGALACNGVDTLVEIPHAAALDITGALTQATWFRLLSTINVSPTTGTAVIWTKEGASGTPYHVGIIDSTGPKFRWFQSGTGLTFNGYPIPIDNVWRHVTFTRSATEISLFINGLLVETLPYTGIPVASSEPVHICTSGNRDATRFAHVELDELRFYIGVLPNAEILALAQTDAPVTEFFFGLQCSIGVGGAYTRIANCPSIFPICLTADEVVTMGSPRTQALPLIPGASPVPGIHVAATEDTSQTVTLETNQQTDIAYVLRFDSSISLSDVRCRPVHADGTPVDQVLTSPPAQVFTGENRLIGTIRGGRFK